MNAVTRILLILDVDETLLFASETVLDREPDCVAGPYFVYHRPHLKPFLFSCLESFDLAVWSSSSAGYLQAVLAAAIPPEIPLRFAWSRGRCVVRFDPERQQQYFVKDLRKVRRIGFDLDRVLIVDDTPQKVERHFGNAVYVSPYLGQAEDDELQRLAEYLRSLRSVTNVRCIEKRGWRRRVP